MQELYVGALLIVSVASIIWFIATRLVPPEAVERVAERLERKSATLELAPVLSDKMIEQLLREEELIRGSGDLSPPEEGATPANSQRGGQAEQAQRAASAAVDAGRLAAGILVTVAGSVGAALAALAQAEPAVVTAIWGLRYALAVGGMAALASGGLLLAKRSLRPRQNLGEELGARLNELAEAVRELREAVEALERRVAHSESESPREARRERPEEWLTVEEARREFGVSKDTLMRYVRSGVVRRKRELGPKGSACYLVAARDLAALAEALGGSLEGWVTLGEAAIELGINKRKVNDLVRSGKLEVRKVPLGHGVARYMWLAKRESVEKLKRELERK